MDPGAERARRPVPAPRSEPSRKNDGIAAVAALLAHALVLGVAWPFAAETKTIEAPAQAPTTTTSALIEIDLHEPETPAPLPAKTADPGPATPNGDGREASAQPPEGRPSGAQSTSRITSQSPPRDVSEPPSPKDVAPAAPARLSPEAPPIASAASALVDEYGVTPAMPMLGGGPLGGSPAWTVPGVLPAGPDMPGSGAPKAGGPIGPRATVAPGRGALVLRDTIAVHDRELGLGNPGGTTAANAVAEAVRASLVPNESTAMLVVRVGGDGVVLSVAVQRFNAGDVASWTGVVQAVTAALGKKKLGLAGLGPKGALVQVEVRSTVTYPSGSHDGPTGVLPSLKDGPPREVMPAPSPDGGDACVPARHGDINPLCGVGMVGGQFDITDLVTKKHRSVRASFNVKLLDDPLARTTPPAPAAPPGVISPAR